MFFRVRLRTPYAVTALGVEKMIERYAPGVEHMLPFHLVTRGPIFFELEGSDEPLRLDDGDIIVLPHGTNHNLTDRPGSPPVPVTELQHAVSGSPPLLDWGGGGDPTEALCGFFHCDSRLFNPLLNALPDVVVIRSDPERSPWLAATLERAFIESAESRAGGNAMVGRLTELLFLEVVQRYVEDGDAAGWLGALGDPLVGAALAQLHEDPGRPWTLEEIAGEVGASRSLISERFSQTVGMSPIRYLTAWRMELAAQLLAESDDPIADIAARIGYESEASFSRAFKRHTGEPPTAWRKQRSQAADGAEVGSGASGPGAFTTAS
jgi:AraC-like DNA-binding protein